MRVAVKRGVAMSEGKCLECLRSIGTTHEADCSRAGIFHRRVEEDDTVERIRPEIQALIRRGNVTLAELQEIRCNSWEWEALAPALDDAAFVDRMQYALNNCAQSKTRPFTVYDDAVKGLYAPELLNRFQRTLQVEKTLADVIDNVREALGQESTHYLVIADDVKELVESVEHDAVDHSEARRRQALGELVYPTDELHSEKVLQKLRKQPGSGSPARPDPKHPHIVDGEFQSDKYPSCPPGKVPLSTKDPMAQDLLWLYAQRRRTVDAEFANDLEFALREKGYEFPREKLPPKVRNALMDLIRAANESGPTVIGLVTVFSFEESEFVVPIIEPDVQVADGSNPHLHLLDIAMNAIAMFRDRCIAQSPDDKALS